MSGWDQRYDVDAWNADLALSATQIALRDGTARKRTAADMAARGRAKRTQCRNGHPYPDDRLYASGARCRICSREKWQRWARKTRAATAVTLALVVVMIPLTGRTAGESVRQGDHGPLVAEVQTILASMGYSVVVDSDFGPQTSRAVKSWQRSNGLTVDGVAGPVTLSSLRRAVRIGNAVTVTAPADPGPAPEHYDIWLRLAVCESGSRWDYNGSSGYDGGLQFSPRTWTAMGGGEFASYAWQATPLEQMIVAERTLDVQGWGAWPTCARKLGLR